MFGMNPTQLEGQVRIFLAMFTGVAGILGWTWFTPLSEAFINIIGPIFAAITPVMGFATIVWSLISKKQGNILTTAATLLDDKGRRIVENIALAPTAAGIALAAPDVTPGNVVVAGSSIPPGTNNQQARRNF